MTPSVVVLLFAHKAHLEPDEVASLQQCYRILGGHPIRLVCPTGLDLTVYRRVVPSLEPDFISPHWFQSLRSYNLLKTLPWLYHRYRQYEFMLTYELDAWVFRDELLAWCGRGWDYIGAPWFAGFYDCRENSPVLGVGNSGFSLRSIKKARLVFKWLKKQRLCHMLDAVLGLKRSALRELAACRSDERFYRPLDQELPSPLPHHTNAEDLFWGLFVPRYHPSFRVAPYEEARAFSFESNAERLYRELGGLPFGCHKWMLLSPEFWHRHISLDLEVRL